MVSKNEIKYIHSLAYKKYRDISKTFVAEGRKVVREFLDVFACEKLFYTSECAECISPKYRYMAEEVSMEMMTRLSLQKSPQGILAVFRMPSPSDTSLPQVAHEELCIALDGVQDPGNVGTILRIADWFGINHIFASQGTADVFSPKVVASTMGALARVQVHYVDLESEIAGMSVENVFGTFLDGKNIYETELSERGVIIMGNEGNGISAPIGAKVGKRLLIPSYNNGETRSESLNVAVATAIVCAEFRRRATKGVQA